MIRKKLLMIGAILNLFLDESLQVTKNNSSERTSALMPGDFIIGVLFSLRHQPKQKKTGPNHFLACGEVILSSFPDSMCLIKYFLKRFASYTEYKDLK